MIENELSWHRTLAIDPSWTGFGFVVVEGIDRLIDWGMADVWATSAKEFLARVESIVERYSPSLIAIEEASSSRLQRKGRERLAHLVKFAASQGIPIKEIPRRLALETLCIRPGNKQQVAAAIADAYPELEIHLPGPRLPWKGESKQINIFDAALIGLAAPRLDLS